jgi:hypothetical protein
MGVQARQIKQTTQQNPVDGFPCLPVFEVKTEAIPLGIYARVQIDAYGHPGLRSSFRDSSIRVYNSSK